MKFWTSRLVLFLLLPLALVAAFFFDAWRNPAAPPEEFVEVEKYPDYFMEQVYARTFSDTGTLDRELRADRFDNFSATGQGQMLSPHVVLRAETGPPWQIRAEQAITHDNGNLIELRRSVRAERDAGPETSDVAMTTEALDLDTVTDIATSELRVHIRTGTSRISGTGMKAELGPQHLLLFADVKASAIRE